MMVFLLVEWGRESLESITCVRWGTVGLFVVLLGLVSGSRAISLLLIRSAMRLCLRR